MTWRLTWFGNVDSMEDDKIPHRVLQNYIIGNRSRGRQRKTRIDNVGEYLRIHNIDIVDVTDLARQNNGVILYKLVVSCWKRKKMIDYVLCRLRLYCGHMCLCAICPMCHYCVTIATPAWCRWVNKGSPSCHWASKSPNNKPICLLVPVTLYNTLGFKINF